MFYDTLGGATVCHNLAAAFYARVARDPILRPLFPGKSLRCATDELSAFLAQFLGGRPEDSQFRWWVSLRESHLRFKIGRRERDAWMKNMNATLDEFELEAPARAALKSLFEEASGYLMNTVPSPPTAGIADPELSMRWEAQRALDEAVAAIRRGDSARAIALVDRGNPAALTALLAEMICSGQPALLSFVRERLSAEPAIARSRYNGRTLLHRAAGSGDQAIVEFLLGFGLDPDTLDSAGHTPLYYVANECSAPGGAAVVRALVKAGANVNAAGGVQRCTPLHMAARRGNVEIAEALLACGAAPTIKDKRGDMPLQRAINCRKKDVAALLTLHAKR